MYNSFKKPFTKFASNTNTRSVTSILSAPMKQFMLPMTSAISNDNPKPEDIQRTKELLQTLESHKIFEPQNEKNHRVEILSKLSSLFKEWVKTVAVANGLSVISAGKLGGKILTFGSYRLGVHQSGADIDALCVAPRCIGRSDFFSTFFMLLKNKNEVTECRAVEGAFVPVIKMNFDGIEVDLLFAQLSLKDIPEDLDLSDDNLLRNLDERCVRSLNGCRVTDAILALIPNHDNFRLALRAIKLWAKKAGIYSNTLGYFGGVTWAMLVARICQLYPTAAAAIIVEKFFLVFSKWKWPLPMLLTRVQNVAELQFSVWDPRITLADRYHLMPVITPAYPQQNSTFNVSASTKKVMESEIKRGLATMTEIAAGRASWDSLFESPCFFNKYRHFVALFVNSETATDHLEWCGLVEARIRLLVGGLERNQHVSLAHINPKCFELKHNNASEPPSNGAESPLSNVSPSSKNSSSSDDDEKLPVSTSPFCSMWFIGLEFASTDKISLDLTSTIQGFVEQVNQFGARIEMLKEGMTISAQYVKRKQLSRYLAADILKSDRKSFKPLSTLLAQTAATQELSSTTATKNCSEQQKRRNGDVINDSTKRRRVEIRNA